MKKVIWILIALAVITTIITFVLEREKQPQEIVRPDCFLVDESYENTEFHIEYCHTESEAVNQEMDALLSHLRDKTEAAGIELLEVETQAKAGLYVTQEMFESVEDVHSTMLTISTYWGGAHPNTALETWTYRADTGEILKFHSLFQPEHNPLETIFPIVKTQLMEKTPGITEEWVTEGTGKTEFEKYEDFVLDGDTLVVNFEPYQVAPYAAGPQQVRIPLKTLEALLQPPFLNMENLPEQRMKPMLQHKESCEAAGGNWLSAYRECEGIGQSWCEQEMGRWNECASACRHDPDAEMCIMVCVPVCGF